jgi:hypothetical protein
MTAACWVATPLQPHAGAWRTSQCLARLQPGLRAARVLLHDVLNPNTVQPAVSPWRAHPTDASVGSEASPQPIVGKVQHGSSKRAQHVSRQHDVCLSLAELRHRRALGCLEAVQQRAHAHAAGGVGLEHDAQRPLQRHLHHQPSVGKETVHHKLLPLALAHLTHLTCRRVRTRRGENVRPAQPTRALQWPQPRRAQLSCSSQARGTDDFNLAYVSAQAGAVDRVSRLYAIPRLSSNTTPGAVYHGVCADVVSPPSAPS